MNKYYAYYTIIVRTLGKNIEQKGRVLGGFADWRTWHMQLLLEGGKCVLLFTEDADKKLKCVRSDIKVKKLLEAREEVSRMFDLEGSRWFHQLTKLADLGAWQGKAHFECYAMFPIAHVVVPFPPGVFSSHRKKCASLLETMFLISDHIFSFFLLSIYSWELIWVNDTWI